MNNKLVSKLKKIHAEKSKVFCAFLTLGYPDLQATGKMIRKFEEAGVDVIELGFPFSDPMADGPTIQYSSERALEKGVKMKDAFNLVGKLREQGCKVPILFFTYLNPVFHYGYKKFAQDCKAAGFDGVVIPDLPPEEDKVFSDACKRNKLSQVFLVAPTTEKKRAAVIAKHSSGFIYYVSLRGVTGARKALPRDVQANLKTLKRVTSKPVLIGFGVSSPEQAGKLSAISEGVIVGSAIVQRLRDSGGKIEPAVNFVRQMVKAVKKS